MQPDPRTGARSTLALRASLLEQNHEIGVSVHDSEATVEASVVRNTQPNAEGFGGRGVNAQTDSATGVVSTLLIRTSLVEHHREASVFVVCAVAMIESCLLHDTLANAEGSFGDGVVAWTELGAPTVPTSATLLATRIDQSARAAVAAIGAHAALGGSAFTCQAIDLDYETNRGEIGRLEDLGGNLCGCPEPTAPCKAVSANLEPPPALESAPE
jgi:hypothetical protein